MSKVTPQPAPAPKTTSKAAPKAEPTTPDIKFTKLSTSEQSSVTDYKKKNDVNTSEAMSNLGLAWLQIRVLRKI